VSGALGQPGTFYVGLPQGGIWKTTSAGQTWFPVGDSIKEVACFGSVQVAPSNPNVVYAGSGEAIGGEGNGIYKSEDAGTTWRHLGLEETQRIPAILVDPKDPNIVLLAALGNNRMHTDQRGVFRSTDGGTTWSKPLFISNEIGVQHIAWAYDNPKVVLALSRQQFLTLPDPSNPKPPPAPAAGVLYRSADEGATWTKLEPTGLPKLTGRCCLAVAQNTNSQRMFLIGTFGLYRSDDSGMTWRQMAKDDRRIVNGQGAYTSGVYVDSQNPDIVYTLATCVYRSIDGGNTFVGFKGAPGGDDPQQLWIDPTDGRRILYGGDQGASVSVDAGQTWGPWFNQPTAQVYHVSTDTQWPYWVYATQQDSGCVGTASRGNLGMISMLDWVQHPGFEFGSMIVDPLNPKISYVLGPNLSLARVTAPSMQLIEIGPDQNPNEGIRAGFNMPMTFSCANPRELIAGYNFLMSTTDGGVHWKKLGPDLTIDKDGKPSAFAAIESLSQSTVAPDTIWVSTNNRIIQVTTDHGKSWTNVSIPNLSRFSQISCIDASHTNVKEAYASVRGGGFDLSPHFYRTRDMGKTWQEIVGGLPKSVPAGDSANVIRADTKRSGLLFGGTQSSVYVSFDDGDHWQPFMLNLPTTVFNDIIIHGNDLIVGTYGRGLYILDDYSPLRQVSAETMAESAHLYKPGEAVRFRRNVNLDTPMPPEIPHADNPPPGAIIYYSLGKHPSGYATLEISDSAGSVVRRMSSQAVVPYKDPPAEVAPYWIEIRKPMPTSDGLNRINWDLRYQDPPAFIHDVQDVINANVGDAPQAVPGPLVLPGTYTLKLTVDGKTSTQTVIVVNDPRSLASQADLKSQHDLQMNYYRGIQGAWEGYQQAAALRTALAELIAAKPTEEIVKAAKALDDKLDGLQGKVVYRRRFLGLAPPTTFVTLNDYLLYRMDALDTGDLAPTDSILGSYGASWTKANALFESWRAICQKDLPALNVMLVKNGNKPLAVPSGTLAKMAAPARQYLPKPEKPGKAAGGKDTVRPEEDGEG
jgi:photosystem II stability/assembly factor-like uncharacterized protein